MKTTCYNPECNQINWCGDDYCPNKPLEELDEDIYHLGLYCDECGETGHNSVDHEIKL